MSMLQVEAWDQDCSPQYSQICNYEIVTAGTPFAIDRNGECVCECVCVGVCFESDLVGAGIEQPL